MTSLLTRLCGAVFCVAALPAVAATFISSNNTVAGGNPLVGNYSGSTVFVGASAFANGLPTRVPNVLVDVLAPGQFNYNDQTGGGIFAYSNSVVNVLGGSFGQTSGTGFGGGLQMMDTSSAHISGGTLQLLGINGSAAGAGGARADVSGGLVQNGVAGVAFVNQGVLNVSGGTLRASGGQSAVVAGAGGVVNISGGLVQSISGAAISVAAGSAVTVSGGTVSGGPNGNSQRGLDIHEATTAVALLGGTVSGGLRATRLLTSSAPAVQAVLHGGVVMGGGAFAYSDAALEVWGGSYSDYSGGPASFFAMGSNTIRFFGTGLALSGPTPGSVFDLNTYTGNYYTFTQGTLADGQNAVGLRLFDAVALGGSTGGLGGGFTLSPVPEPGRGALMLLALPLLAGAARRRLQRPAFGG